MRVLYPIFVKNQKQTTILEWVDFEFDNFAYMRDFVKPLDKQIFVG